LNKREIVCAANEEVNMIRHNDVPTYCDAARQTRSREFNEAAVDPVIISNRFR
jgi:hypothetical protein